MWADILSAITTVGFPIVACIYMAYVYDNIQKKLFDVVNENTTIMTEVKEELHHVAGVVRSFTEAEDDYNAETRHT